MKRHSSEMTIDLNDIEHNKRIKLEIEDLKKQLKIENHNTGKISIKELKKLMGRLMSGYSFNIAAFTIFKHDVFSTGKGEIFKNIWQFVGEIGLSRIAKVHAHYENEIDRAESRVDSLLHQRNGLLNILHRIRAL